jgi:hypothetical protein
LRFPQSGLPHVAGVIARRPGLAAALAFTAIWGAIVARWWFSDAVVPWDSKNHFYPMLRFLAERIHAGEWPLWNPFHFSGFPTAADPQSLLFAPSMLLLAALDPEPSLFAFDVAVAAHLLAGGLGLIALFRVKGWHALAGLAAALVYAFGGSAMMRLQHTGMIISYGLFPLALVTLEIALARRSFLAAIGFGVAAAFMALGRDQVAFLFCVALVALAVTRLATAERPLRFLVSRLPVLLVMAVVGAAILAVPMLLTLQLLATSNRPQIGLADALHGSLHPINLATLFAPDIFGALSEFYRYWGPSYMTVPGNLTDPPINQIFAGTLVVVLILWHGLGGGRLAERPIRFWTIASALALLYAFGDATPFYAFAYDWLPGVRLYRRPADATFFLNITLALSTGYLLHRWISDGVPKLGRLAVGAVVLAAATMLIAALAFTTRADRLTSSIDDAALAFVLVVAGGLALAWASPDRRRTAFAAALVLLTAGELGWRNAASPLNAEPRWRYAFLEQPRPGDQRILDALDAEIERRHEAGQRPRVEMVGVNGPWMNAPMVHGIESTLGYNPLRLQDYQTAVGPGENSGDFSLRRFPATFRTYRSELARLLGIEYIVLGAPIEQLPSNFPRIEAQPIASTERAYLYRLPNAVPRAYFAPRVRVMDVDAYLQRGELPRFEAGQEAVVDDDTLPRRVYGRLDRPCRSRVTIVAYRANEVELEVETDRPGIVVLHDIYYPGWTVEVDGERRDILRTNVLFRGVELETGRHRIVFRFQPLALDNLMAAATSLLGGRARQATEPVESVPQAPASDLIASVRPDASSGTRVP